jgi:DNA-binding NtrC family response regulator
MGKIVEKTRKILIIEDELSIREICRRVLLSEGYEVDMAINGRNGKAMSSRKVYDLYLVDIRTPEINGLEFYEWLVWKYPKLKKRIIFTTGDLREGDIVSRVKETGRPLLPKPFTASELRDIIEKTIKEM